ncbi:hypothetical protein ES319_A11G077200v1 [Gossypium barbadense]|uniref:Uncharacterized protein n=2 Tax=Gossypium TaxID=3633 RepID=A0A5J5TNS5_GOSBA|nr:hypothetical protein ES319_A11G077200v1 [Gossypium barbadense]TYG93067.1 hypothetical protein ES288_A11G081200v1 [Gossypium darwinii]
MGGSWFLKLLLISMLFILSFSQGLGRKWMENNVELQDYSVQLEQEYAERAREMIEIMDYKEPGPNTNPRTSYIFGPPPQPQP